MWAPTTGLWMCRIRRWGWSVVSRLRRHHRPICFATSHLSKTHRKTLPSARGSPEIGRTANFPSNRLTNGRTTLLLFHRTNCVEIIFWPPPRLAVWSGMTRPSGTSIDTCLLLQDTVGSDPWGIWDPRSLYILVHTPQFNSSRHNCIGSRHKQRTTEVCSLWNHSLFFDHVQVFLQMQT